MTKLLDVYENRKKDKWESFFITHQLMLFGQIRQSDQFGNFCLWKVVVVVDDDVEVVVDVVVDEDVVVRAVFSLKTSFSFL